MKRLNIKAFWSRVKLLIKERATTQDAAAKAIGVLPGTFRNWIARGRIPPLNYAFMLAQYLEVNLNYLTGGYGPDRTTFVRKEVLSMLKKASDRLRSV